jgi:hypothetical protein
VADSERQFMVVQVTVVKIFMVEAFVANVNNLFMAVSYAFS